MLSSGRIRASDIMRVANEQRAEYDMRSARITIYPAGHGAFCIRADHFVEQLLQGHEVFEVVWVEYSAGQNSYYDVDLRVASKESTEPFIEVLLGCDNGCDGEKLGNLIRQWVKNTIENREKARADQEHSRYEHMKLFDDLPLPWFFRWDWAKVVMKPQWWLGI